LTKVFKFGLASVAAVAALSLVSPAQAAPGPAVPGIGGPTSISIGGFFPGSHDATDRGGSTQFVGEFRYTLPVPNPLDVPTRTVASLGVETGARDGKHSTVIPITIGEEVGLNKTSPSAGGQPYAGGGLGVYVINQDGISTATRIGGYLVLGYNVNSSVYVDAKYQFVDHADGPLVQVGLRF
jgi:hypothetical protein